MRSRGFFIFLSTQLLALVSCNSNDIITASDSMEELFNSAKGVHLRSTCSNIVAMAAVAIGIITAFLGLAMITEQLFATEEWVVTASWVAFVIGGVLCGFLALCLTTFDIFAVGTVAGVMLAMVLNDALGYLIYPSNPGVVLALLGGIRDKAGESRLDGTTPFRSSRRAGNNSFLVVLEPTVTVRDESAMACSSSNRSMAAVGNACDLKHPPQPLSTISSVEASEWISSLELWPSGTVQIVEIKLSKLDRRGDDSKDTFADSASS